MSALRQSYLPLPSSAFHIQHLRIFATVAGQGGVTRAAGQLFKAASAVTRSVLDLERALGVPLFERKPRGMLLTNYGEAALTRALRVEAEIDAAARSLLNSPGEHPPASASAVQSLLSTGRKLLLINQLVQLRSISAAAGELGISQAGASMALGRIEGMLGHPLFQRRLEGMLPTEQAEELAGHAARIFAELRHLDSDIAGIAGNVAGAVVVGTTPLGRSNVFTTAIAAACDRHPALRVTTVESSYGELVAGLRRGSIDLVVGVPRPADESAGLTSEILFVDQLSILVGAKHPLSAMSDLTMSDLLSQRWILPRSTLLGRSFIESCFEAMDLTPPRPVIETGDPGIIRQLLVSTDMIAACSPHQLRSELDAGAVVDLPVSLPEARRAVGLIQRDGAMLSSAALAVADELRRQAKLLPRS